MAASTTTCQGIWIIRLLCEIENANIKPPLVYIDKKSDLDLKKNPMFHGKSKHIDKRFHYIQECVENEEVTIQHVSINKQQAHILTKSMKRTKFGEMRDLLGVKKITSLRGSVEGVE